ncbi:hypothetical protein [Roseateles oligotrophus]|uniref:Uncharacterized protein n=1 Tax=Roseateles oligotrophus TaxID=1769250 RepID=A0ABT2YKU3_9BURK|nr:hypothetical protein [Roseateles oligotrophus]MCV2370669.1 hypothetical protein [Roseateles oligotrophus]
MRLPFSLAMLKAGLIAGLAATAPMLCLAAETQEVLIGPAVSIDGVKLP